MSTPLFSDSADDRRSEDYARKVLIQLHSALNWDERYDWRKRYGGEAVAEMLVRYGWPAFSVYGGRLRGEEPRELDALLRQHAHGDGGISAGPGAPHSAVDGDRRSVPRIGECVAAQHAAAQGERRGRPRSGGPTSTTRPVAGDIAQLPEQTVMLRRDDDIVLATASELRFGSKRDQRRHGGGGAHPHHVARFHRASAAARRAATRRRSSSRRAFRRVRRSSARRCSRRAARRRCRTRFGITPPAPLSALKPGEAAISDPVLIATAENVATAPKARSTRCSARPSCAARRSGVYWETYGYGPGDSVDVAFIITRTEKLSAFRRLGMKLRVAHDINGSVAVRWSEPQAGHDSWTIPSKVPIQARVVTLDLSQLEPGHYSVQVLASRAGGIPVTASRDFAPEAVTRSRHSERRREAPQSRNRRRPGRMALCRDGCDSSTRCARSE